MANETTKWLIDQNLRPNSKCNFSDTHVDSAVEYTTRATNDTKKALEYQSKARRKKIMMMLCMIVAGSLGSYIGLKYLGFVWKNRRNCYLLEMLQLLFIRVDINSTLITSQQYSKQKRKTLLYTIVTFIPPEKKLCYKLRW